MALARRVLLGVFGSAAAEQTSQVKQCLAALRQGLLGKARPGLLIPGAGASSLDDPLSFLDKMTDGAGSLATAFVYMQTALCVAFPMQADKTMRWFVAVQQHVNTERGRGASCGLLSAWWAGVCRACDRRVERLMQREVGVLLPLNQEVITDPVAKYNAVYHQARALEMAESAAQAVGDRAVAAALKGRGTKVQASAGRQRTAATRAAATKGRR